MARWRDYRSYLETEYGARVYRVGVDGGFSCPNRNIDGSGGCTFCDGTGSKAAYQRWEESSLSRGRFDAKRSAAVLLSHGSLDERVSSVLVQARRGRDFVRRRYKAELFSLYFQAWTNTNGPVGDLKRMYDAALEDGEYVALIVSTRPDSIDEEKADLLASYQGKAVRKVWVELGLQSANDETLKRINRGHDSAAYEKACALLHERGLSVSTHVILGLRGEGRSDYLATAALVARAGSEGVKIHNLHICGGTAMLDEFLLGEMSVGSMERHVENVELFLRHIPSRMIIERFLCETPSHRLAAPVSFGAKNLFLKKLEEKMERDGATQGDLYETT